MTRQTNRKLEADLSVAPIISTHRGKMREHLIEAAERRMLPMDGMETADLSPFTLLGIREFIFACLLG